MKRPPGAGGPGASGARKRCVVVYAIRERQYLWEVELPDEATIAQALVAARELAAAHPEGADAPAWNTAPVGVFGELRSRDERCADGDRIEIYRPLRRDPRERRREQVRRERDHVPRRKPKPD
ncbi:MAG TPA: RnfH family protein [Steroidobacteraceae bacterium]|jgi:putative ubiquitin-RnfH superfamily antitoxin RatB of RatAB toxin-antitoxin module|nr:RnfH family protein [Steroidobacteraceae bacterium]